MLEQRLADLVAKLVEMARAGAVVLLDYETNEDVEDTTRPLSHAGLVKRVVQERLASG